MARLADLMSSSPVTTRVGAPPHRIVRRMAEHGVTSVVLLDDEGQPADIVTERDIVRYLYKHRSEFDMDWFRAEPWPWDTRQKLVTARKKTTVMEAVELMVKHGIGHLPVVDGQGRLAGMVIELDLLRWLATLHAQLDRDVAASNAAVRGGRSERSLKVKTVARVMTSEPPTAPRTANIERILRRMATTPTGSVILVDKDQHPVEVVTLSDVVRLLARRSEEPHMSWLWIEHMDRPEGWVLESVRPDTPITKAFDRMERRHVHRMPVMDDDGRLVGVVRLWDLLAVLVGVERPNVAPA